MILASIFISALLTRHVKGGIRKNIALMKDANQSSTFAHKVATVVVDGNPDTCTRTDNTLLNEQWWAVDLGHLYNIHSLKIFNKKACCQKRLRDYYIYIYNPRTPTWSEFDKEQGNLCYFHEGVSPLILNVACEASFQGRYVKIYMPDPTLAVCEVEIYAKPTTERSATGTYCLSRKKNILLKLDKQLLHSTLTECAIFCQQTASCLGFEMVTYDICSVVRSSKDDTVENENIAYYERC